MDQFQKKFIEEASELVADLERNLLLLEGDPVNHELIEAVFRAMHTLKGSGAMFGFNKISRVNHMLETVYGFIRDNRLEMSKPISDLTLSAVDHMRQLLNDPDCEDAKCQETNDILLDEISKIIKDVDVSAMAKIEALNPAKNQAQTSDNITWYILFQPEAKVLERGVNINALLAEVRELGPCEIVPQYYAENSIPHNRFYMFWQIFLVTDQGKNAIDDVFIFVEDEYKVLELAKGNVLDKAEFKSALNAISDRPEPLNIVEFRRLVGGETVQSKPREERVVVATPKTQFVEQKISSIRVDTQKLDELVNLVSELVTNQATLSLVASEISHPLLNGVNEKLERLTKRLRDTTLSISLIPIENLMVRFRRLVRDLSLELGKKVEFVTEGTETELDKKIIDGLSGPLMHILRNGIDHGIEYPDERQAKGKAETGVIKLRSYYSGTDVFIVISDDGGGINLEKVRKKAIEKGFITPEAVLTDKELVNLTFKPGFSTADNVSEVSGRGVGMDVVKRKIAEIRGEVYIETWKDIGTEITIKLPLTLSIIDALLITVGESFYLLPLQLVDKCFDVQHHEVERNKSYRMVLDGELTPYVYLRREFGIAGEPPETEKVVTVKYEDKVAALIIDSIVDEHQAVLKPLGDMYKNQDVISSASILGDGNVALVLDTNRLIHALFNK